MLQTFLITNRSSHVFGWTRQELLLLAGLYNVFFGVFYFLFAASFTDMTNIIRLGRLDGLLLLPVDSQFSVSTRRINVFGILRSFIGAIFCIIIFQQLHATISLLQIVEFSILFILGIILMYSFWFAVLTLLIWNPTLSNLLDFLYINNAVTKYPQEMFKGGSELLYVALFPLTLVLVIPAKILLMRATLLDIFWLVILGLVFFICSRKFWKFALRSYTSASG